MKNKGFIAIALLIGAMGCSINLEEDLAPEESNDLKLVFAVDSFIDGDSVPDTKTSVVPNENYSSYDFRWSAKDTVGIYPDAGNQVYFSMAAGAGATSAEFDGGAWTCKNGHEYRSYYPFIGKMYLDATKIPVSFTGQKQIGNTNSDHFQQCDYMYTGVTTKEGSLLNFAYHHLVTVVSPWLELPAGHYTDLTLSLDEPLFVTEGRYDLTAATPAIVGTQFSSTMHMDLDITLASADILRAFVLLAPINMTGHPLTITVTDENDVDYQYTYNPQRAYVAGTVYRLRASTNFADPPIAFADDAVKAICVDLWDTDSDGELSMSEAAAVTSIPYSAFSGKSITSFDEFQYFTGVTSLGYDSDYDEGMDYYGAFYNCTSLTSITLPPTLQTINYACFRECANLEEITIPASVQTIQQIAFLGCEKLVVHMESDTPCTLQKDTYDTYPDPYVFGFLTSGRVKAILVPDADAETAYKAAQYWPSSLIHAEGWIDPSLIITFQDATTKLICVDNWDTNQDGELSYVEAAAVTDFGVVMKGQDISYFDELVYFTGINSLANDAFRSCTLLRSISLPPQLTSIGTYAFYGCSQLSQISFPSQLSSIGTNAFYGCSQLNKVTVPSLELWINVVSPSRIFSVPGDLYINDSLVTDFVLPENSVSVPNYVCRYLHRLESVVIPSSVTSIGDEAFRGCSSLETISIPDGVTTIGNSAFNGCSSLETISIPDGVTTIGNSAFNGCSSLETINIPDGVNTLDSYIFKGCSSLNAITIPESVRTIGQEAFNGCSSLTSISLPNQLETIGGKAFAGCSLINAVKIPDTVTTIHSVYSSSTTYGAFYESSVETVECNISLLNPSGIQSLSKLGLAFSYARQYSIGGSNRAQIKSITITKSSATYQIPTRSFEDFSGLETLVLPAGVTRIGSYAFKGCSSLTESPIQNTVKVIEDYAFQYCTGLTSIPLPDGLQSIGAGAFESCKGLTQMVIPSLVTRIESKTFNNCWVLASVTLPDGLTYIGDQAFATCAVLSSITIPTGVTTIGQKAFYECGGISSIIIPEGVTAIQNETFYACINLETVILPNGLTSIGDYVFTCCHSLTSLVIPSSILSIGSYTFGSISNALTRFGNIAMRCYGLQSISILATTPPTLGTDTFTGANDFHNDCPLYVPSASVDAYKAASGWANYSSRIMAQ